MNKRIYHDSKMSYLIIEPETDIASSLSMNMMKNNKIQGLLDMECRYADNNMALYYEIQGLQCMKEYIGEYNINYNVARQLFLDIAQAVLNGEEFFLSENSYVINLEYIFWDKKNKRAEFCCVPELQGDFQADIKKLTEELIEYIDHSDKIAVEFIYGIYDLITDNGFIISDAKAYINGFKPGIVSGIAHNNKIQNNTFKKKDKNTGNNIKKQHNIPEKSIEFIPASAISEGITDTNVNQVNKKATDLDKEKTEKTRHKKYVLCISQFSLPFKTKEKGDINIYLDDIGTIADENHFETSVGRSSDCNLILPVCFISRHHAVLYIENENFYVEDLNSANGTFINGEKIPANVKILCDVNDIISFAGIKCRLYCK